MRIRMMWAAVLGLAVLAWSAAAQTTVNSQTSASGSSSTSASASQSGAQVKTDNSAAAQQNTSVSQSQPKAKEEQKAKGSASSSAAGSASAGKGGASANLASGTTLQAVLSKPVDAKKNKEGDPVMARTAQDVKSEGSVVIPKNSQLIGHVTQAKVRDKAKGEAESSLGIVFDRAILKNGQEVPLHAVIQAVAAAQNDLSAMTGEGTLGSSAMGTGYGSAGASAARSGGGLVGNVGSTVGSTVNTTAGLAGNAAGNVTSTAAGTVNSSVATAGSATGALGKTTSAATQLTATGVVGLPGLALNSQASNATQGSVITSSSRNVRLDSGTQMVLRVTGSE